MTHFIVAALIVSALVPATVSTRSTAAARASHDIETAARRGPPWISVEHPVNPHDATTRGAFIVVHAYHHGTPTEYPLSGTAEGIVGGQRRTVKLDFQKTSRSGAYAVRKQWGDAGVWTLMIAVAQGKDDAAQALVEIAPSGTVASVRVPTRTQGQWTIPAPVSLADVESALHARAKQLAQR